MSHHFQARGGTVFNFNSDLSGEVRVLDGARYEAHISAADLLEFVDWWRSTPGYGLDEESARQQLKLHPVAVRTNAQADAFRGVSECLITLGGTISDWPVTVLRYFVTDVLWPGGNLVRCEDPALGVFVRSFSAPAAASHPDASPTGSAPAGDEPT